MPDDGLPFPETTHELALDPEVLARELAQELLGDPLDEIDTTTPSSSDVAAECDLGITLLKGDREQRLQGLRIFCEHRDPRAIPLLLPLLGAGCPIVRMSAVYALGRNPHPLAVEPLLGSARLPTTTAMCARRWPGAWATIPMLPCSTR